ncbi:hypothetical protein ZWY2020_016486 [Hordeum vulgare]|nr:hypothetical protein ZWY2020_016486 [Hordeum vulgare]
MATKSSSAVVVHAGEHLFKVVGHSLITGSNTVLMSDTFRVGDHDWAITYYPNGDTRVVDDQFCSVLLNLMNAGEEELTASFTFSLQDPMAPATGEKHTFRADLQKFSSSNRGWGRLMDDRQEAHDKDGVIVPPSDLSKDIANLLDSGLKPDLVVKIGWFKRFKVHACVLAARSPVFQAQLCGAMMESRESSIRVEDMDAKVFEIMLYFMYNDRLPESMDEATEETTNMAQHLLVTADRYAIERLKLVCESRLSKALDINTVGFTLDLAEQYHCQQLKDCCLRYMTQEGERLRDIINTKGFAQLKRNQPRVAFDVLGQVIALLPAT